MNLRKLNEEFIEQARRPMEMGRLPVEPQEADVPVIPVDRWYIIGDSPKVLFKTYRFRRPEDRNRFVTGLMAYESDVGHHATITVTEEQVELRLFTKNVEIVTEIDKEYARFADVTFRDLVYSP